MYSNEPASCSALLKGWKTRQIIQQQVYLATKDKSK